MILNGKMINPGELNTKITLAKRVKTVDAGGFPVMAYVFTWSGYIESGILSFWAPLRQGGRPG